MKIKTRKDLKIEKAKIFSSIFWFKLLYTLVQLKLIQVLNSRTCLSRTYCLFPVERLLFSVLSSLAKLFSPKLFPFLLG